MTVHVTDGMTYEERTKWFAGGNVTIGTLSQVVEGELKSFFVGKVRGTIIPHGGKFMFDTEAEARSVAVAFRDKCRLEVGQE